MVDGRIIGHIDEGRSYVATVTPPLAQDLFFVSTYDEKDSQSNAADQHGYQRPPTIKRFKEIGDYFLANDHRFLITPLLVSIRLNQDEEIKAFLELVGSGDGVKIKKKFGAQVASVIDGQHRYKGIINAWHQNPDFLPEIPCIFFFGLSFIDEAEFFNVVNATQRKLPTALIETTKGDITNVEDTGYRQQIRALTFRLCRDTDSVWGPVKDPVSGELTESINMTGVRDPNRRVTYEGLRRSTSNMFPKPLLSRLTDLDKELPQKYAKRYWRLVSECCPQAWNGDPATRTVIDDQGEVHEERIKYRIKDLVGVASLAKLGQSLIQTHIDSGDSTQLDHMVEKLVDVDWEKHLDNPWMRSQAGFAGQKELYELLYALVYADKRPDDPRSEDVTEIKKSDEMMLTGA